MPSTAAAREERIELRAERIVLSQRDSECVQALLDSPPAPTPALKEASRRRSARL